MKRRMLTQPSALFAAKNDTLNRAQIPKNYVPVEIPDDLNNYAQSLRLLQDVPLSYLFSDITDISEESIRFFCLDVNWTDALLDGAFSIGRICGQDAVMDKTMLKAEKKQKAYEETPRMKRMHKNHKTRLLQSKHTDLQEDYTDISGFVMRSQMVSRMKGLHVFGYDKTGAPKGLMEEGTPLAVLRMETIADQMLLCLFHGQVCEIRIEEPKTGLRFGVSSVETGSDGKLSRTLDLRSALDSPKLGERIGPFCIDEFTQENGRIMAGKLANAVGKKLKGCGGLGTEKMTPSRFAFELIAIAHRVEFHAGKADIPPGTRVYTSENSANETARRYKKGEENGR